MSDQPEKIQLTPTPYAVFKVLVSSEHGTMNYTDLKVASGMGEIASFPKHIQELNGKGIVKCFGPHRNRVVVLNIDPSLVEEFQRYARKTSRHARPEVGSDYKKRICLYCKEPFLSEWAGKRICHDCKTTPAWQDPDNPFTPEGDTDGSGLSDQIWGLY